MNVMTAVTDVSITTRATASVVTITVTTTFDNASPHQTTENSAPSSSSAVAVASVECSGLSSGAKVGIGAGVAVGSILIISVGAVAFWFGKKRASQEYRPMPGNAVGKDGHHQGRLRAVKYHYQGSSETHQPRPEYSELGPEMTLPELNGAGARR